MAANQFNSYAKFYDLLYREKDYRGEAAWIHQLIRKNSKEDIREFPVLDLACGTGKHLGELAALGYKKLSGSDISASMIGIARERSKAKQENIEYYNYSFQEAYHILPKRFGVVLSMFSAVNYLTHFDDQLKAFQNVHALLEDDGLFIFDYWNGNAVVRDYSPVKVLQKKAEHSELIRISRTNLNLITQQVEVNFQCLYLEDDQKRDEFEEVHLLHYYFYSEMENLLSVAGFRILSRLPFMENRELGPYDWNVSIVAQKIKQK